MANKAPDIVRTEVIVVDGVEENQYGDLIVTDKEGTTHKVGNKRTHLFEQFEVDRATKVGYASYMNKEYIATAERVEMPTQEPTHKTMKPDKQNTPDLIEEAVKMGAKVIPQGDERLRSMAIAYSKDLAAAGKIELKDLKAYADKFLAYILNQ